MTYETQPPLVLIDQAKLAIAEAKRLGQTAAKVALNFVCKHFGVETAQGTRWDLPIPPFGPLRESILSNYLCQIETTRGGSRAATSGVDVGTNTARPTQTSVSSGAAPTPVSVDLQTVSVGARTRAAFRRGLRRRRNICQVLDPFFGWAIPSPSRYRLVGSAATNRPRTLARR